MADESYNWEDYYQKIEGLAPHQLLLEVLEKLQSYTSLHAIDLGCGDGIESVVLLERGWNVLAIDAQPAAIKCLVGKVSDENQVRLQTQVAKFEDVVFPSVDLIHAGLSIPFCHPEYFPTLWGRVVTAIKPGGRFAGQLFGVRDSWVVDQGMIFLTEDQVRALFKNFDIETFHELDEDGQATSGPKHWHMFTIIARKMQGCRHFLDNGGDKLQVTSCGKCAMIGIPFREVCYETTSPTHPRSFVYRYQFV